MKIYRFCLRVVSVIVGIAFLLFGGFFATWTMLWSLRLAAFDDEPPPSSLGEFIVAVLLVAMGLGLAGLGWRLLSPPSREIRLTYYPSIDLVRVSVETRARGRMIRVREQAAARFWPRSGNARKLRIRLIHGSIRHFSLNEIERFVADMRATYPIVSAARQGPIEQIRESSHANEELEPT